MVEWSKALVAQFLFHLVSSRFAFFTLFLLLMKYEVLKKPLLLLRRLFIVVTMRKSAPITRREPNIAK